MVVGSNPTTGAKVKRIEDGFLDILQLMIVDFDKLIRKIRDDIPEHSIVRKISKYFFRGNSSRLYVITPYWHATLSSFAIRGLKRRILKAGHSCLIYQFPIKILSANIPLTKRYFKEIQKKIKIDIKIAINKYGFSEVIVIGMSLGCVNALMIANKNPDVNKVILVVPGDSLAESLWMGISTTDLKNQIKKHGINLEELEKDWKELAPKNNINGLKGKDIEVHLSKSDEVIPYKNGRGLIKDMKKTGLRPAVSKNKELGHYLTVSKFILREKF